MISIYVLTRGGLIIYVGQTRQPIHKRWYGHTRKAKRFIPDGMAVVEQCNTPASANEAERKWISAMNAAGNESLYNVLPGGVLWPPELDEQTRMMLGHAIRATVGLPQHRKQRSERLKALWADPEWRSNLLAKRGSTEGREVNRQAQIRYWNEHRDELMRRRQEIDYREKLSAAKYKYWSDPKNREAQSRRLSGRIITPEHRKKISQAKLGTKASNATRVKLSMSRIGKKFTAQHRANLSASRIRFNKQKALAHVPKKETP